MKIYFILLFCYVFYNHVAYSNDVVINDSIQVLYETTYRSLTLQGTSNSEIDVFEQAKILVFNKNQLITNKIIFNNELNLKDMFTLKFKEHIIYEYDNNSNLIKENYFYDGKTVPSKTVLFQYNSKNRIISKTEMNGNQVVETIHYDYEFSSDNNYIQISKRYIDNEIIEVDSFSYKNNLLTKEVNVFNDGIVVSSYFYKNTNLVKIDVNDQIVSGIYNVFNDYDERGNLIRHEAGGEGEIYTYDENNNVLSKVGIVMGRTSTDYGERYKYVYDVNQRWVEKRQYDYNTDKLIRTIKRKFIYFSE